MSVPVEVYVESATYALIIEPSLPDFLTAPSPVGAVVVPVGGPAGPAGADGAPGAPGEQGPPGTTGAGFRTVRKNFASPDTVWTFVHNLNTTAMVVKTYDADGVTEKESADPVFPDANTVSVEWYYPETGIMELLY